MNEPDSSWELPWPRLDVPAYREGRVGAWSIQNAFLLAPRGYFHAGPAGGVARHTMLVRHGGVEPVTVMSTLPLEIESNAKHVAAASGGVLVMGAGLGLTVHNMLKKPDVERVVLVERDPDVIELLRQSADVDDWEGAGKLSLEIGDASSYVPTGPVDFLYADVWDVVGTPEALAETQAMQARVRARRVGWWGQEISFARWLLDERHGFPATVELFRRWADSIDLPLEAPGDEAYVDLIETVARGCPEKVGLEPPPPPAPASAPRAAEAGLVESATAPDGTRFTLLRRGEAFGIRVDGRELMASEARASEEALATLACETPAGRAAPRVLVGGLGMGFTLRAALDALPPDAQVTVVEVVGEIVAWNRRHLGALNGDALSDPRVTVVVADVDAWLRASGDAFDAILLDVDNGPAELSLASNAALYTTEGLGLLARRLRPGGVLAVWSAARDGPFEALLDEAGFEADARPIAAAAGEPRHVVYLALRR